MLCHNICIKTNEVNVVMRQNSIDRVNSTMFLELIIDEKLK